MKIIQSGNQPWSQECICSNCQAKLLVEYSDLYKRLEDHNFAYIYFSCPECLDETNISYNGPNWKLIPLRTDNIIKIKSIIETFISYFKLDVENH
jgi:hypothetical protein